MMALHRIFILRAEPYFDGLFAFLKANWRAMLDQHKPLAVTVTEAKSKRSLDQNAKLHAVLNDIAEQAWVNGRQYDMATWKEWYRRKFVGVEIKELPDGTQITIGRSTTELDVGEMADLITRIMCDAADEYGMPFDD